MKVYTHFEKKEGVRWRTLLQYGDSWDIIGSVVMMNPGSANFKRQEPISGEILSKLQSFENGVTGYDWYEFSEDNAMLNVGKLFTLKQGLKDRNQLNGVIQIFNLFYIREADLEKAKKMYSQTEQPKWLTSEYDLDCLSIHNGQPLTAPIYLGFGGLAFDSNFREKAEYFFNSIIKKCNYLHSDYNANKFYYPTYLLSRGVNNPRARQDLGKFLLDKNELNEADILKLKEEYDFDIYSGNAISAPHLSPNEIKRAELQILVNLADKLYDKKRLRDNPDAHYGITIASQKIMIRQAYEGKTKTAIAQPEDAIIRDRLQERGYTQEGNWLGVRKLSSFSDSVEDIVEKVSIEIKELFDILNIQ